MALSNLTWSFDPLVTAFPPTIFPNTALWNVSNNEGLEYQIQVSWPLGWNSTDVAGDVLAMYVLDGNALGQTASEGFRRRLPVEPTQPDSIVISIGYPLTNAVYSDQRAHDFRPPIENATEGVTPGADEFIQFINGTLRPFVRSELFPNANFTRDALYGHSFGGLFTLYALVTNPGLFDVFFSASPALFWENGRGVDLAEKLGTAPQPESKPGYVISYGSLEQFPVKRRTETQEEFEARKAIIETFRMTDYCQELYARLKNSTKLRDVQIKEYEGQDHSSVAASAITDGIDYFVDW